MEQLQCTSILVKLADLPSSRRPKFPVFATPNQISGYKGNNGPCFGNAVDEAKIGQSGSTGDVVVWDVLEVKQNGVQVKMPPNNHPQVKKKRVTTVTVPTFCLPPHKRARHVGPMFYDVSTNTLFDPSNMPDCNNRCRVCMAEECDEIKWTNIFGAEGTLARCAMKINKFLPIQVSENDGFPQLICLTCKDVLNKINTLSVTCQRVNAYYENRKRLREEDEVLEVFDEESYQNPLDFPEHVEESLNSPKVIETPNEPAPTTASNNSLPNTDSLNSPKGHEVEIPSQELLLVIAAHNDPVSINNIAENQVVKRMCKIIPRRKGSAKTALTIAAPTQDLLVQKKGQRKSFSCKFCDKKMDTILHFVSHYEKRHQIYLCRYCFEHFDSMSRLEEHSRSVHQRTSNKTAFDCPLCSMRSPSRTLLQNHMAKKHAVKHMCFICYKSFDLETEYKDHINSVRHELQCKFCGKCFETRTSVQRHVEFHHKESFVADACKCVLCNGEFLRLATLKRHYLDFHQRFYCTPCNTSFASQEDINSHCLAIHDSPTTWVHRCQTCSKYFDTIESLKSHLETHNATQRYLCEVCGREYRKERNLQLHVEEKHNKSKGKVKSLRAVECHICGKTVVYRRIAAHIRTHLGLRDVLCQQCGKKFCSNDGLKRHASKVHNMLKCPTCHGLFSPLLLEEHAETEHIMEWSYVCNYCTIRCNELNEITVHCDNFHFYEDAPKYLKTSQHQCDKCLEFVGNAAKLKVHKYKVHYLGSNKCKRMKLCEICGENVYSDKYSYKYHMYKCHDVPLEYQCDRCDRSFVFECHLKRHSRKFHEQDAHPKYISRKSMTKL